MKVRGVRPPGPSRLLVWVRVHADGYAVAEGYEAVVEKLAAAKRTGDPVIELTRGGSDTRILFVVDQIECVHEERVPA